MKSYFLLWKFISKKRETNYINVTKITSLSFTDFSVFLNSTGAQNVSYLRSCDRDIAQKVMLNFQSFKYLCNCKKELKCHCIIKLISLFYFTKG